MKLTIKRIEFLKMLTYAAQAIPSRNAEMQFLNYLIDVKEDGVSVIASNGDISTKVFQPLKDEKENDIIFNCEPGLIQTQAKLFLDCISKMGGEVITLTMVDSNLLNLADETTNFNLVTRAGEEYPDVDLNVPAEAKGFEVSLADLKLLFDTTSYAVATKGPKDLYYGINVRAEGGKLTFLTTDSYRMASLSIPAENQDTSFVFTCPVKALDMVTKIGENGKLTIYFDEQRALFVSGNITLSSRLLRGDFPSVDRLIPPSFPYSVTIDTAEFLAAADRVKIISSVEDRNSQVKLSLNKDAGVTLSAKSANFGNSNEVLRKASIVLPEEVNIFEIGFNIDFAVDAVKALKSDKITFVFASPTRMFMVRNENPANIQIITPIRMSAY
jgi:DNA polymerase III subunit beta